MASNFGTPWADGEDQIIRECFGQRAARDALLRLLPGRTWRAIGMRASKLGVTACKISGPNRHEIRDGIGIIHLDRRDGSSMPCKVPARKIKALITFGRWRVHETSGMTYARSGRTYLHRLLTRCPKDKEVDHRDGDGLNNVLRNLRIVSRGENNQNRSMFSGLANSGYRNVGFHAASGLWRARLRIEYKEIVRYFRTKKDAIAGAAALRREFHPHNTVDPAAY